MEGIDLSALSEQELQQKVEEIVQQRVQAELEANRIDEGEVTYAQPPSGGNPVPPTGSQPSPSSQGKTATFNDPSSVAHIVAQAAKATAEAIAEQQGTIKDETDANKDIARGLPSSLYAVQKEILLAHDVLTLRTLETVVRDAHMEMERERSKGERREVERALAASGMGRRGGGNWGASGGQDGGQAAAGGQNCDGEKKNSDVFNDNPGGFCRYHQSELHTNEQCRLQQQLRRARSREGAAERRSGGGSRGGRRSQRGGRPPPGPGRGGRWVRLEG
ncbi:unnamed protein product [Ectocarpus sp. CCAP 1310/34]|nr:unnamed protein product [Ectocarpus sp. CCAP 1310/34]